MKAHISIERQCEFAKLPIPETEYIFAKSMGRRWRFDFCWPEQHLALEVNGGGFIQGRHTRGAGFEKDCEKLSAAAILGFRVLHVLPKQVQSGAALMLIEKALKHEG